ncbi:MAG TPA: sulfatase [Candidatus Binatia bacterium]|nr:sulfatase [Candidatus Binatia bacterium]
MTRTPWCWVALAAVLTVAGTPAYDGRASAAGPPNIILVLTDDLDSASMASLPGIRGLLADPGVTFSQFFVSDSLCCPSRTSILCGQYNHNHHVLTNGPPDGGYDRFNDLGHEGATIGRWLHDAGYRTVLMGKYLNGYPGDNASTSIPPGWDEWYVPADGEPYTEFRYTMNENGHLVDYGDRAADYMVDVLAAKAEEFIRASAGSEQPFFMYVAPYAPHAPYIPAPRDIDAFIGVQAPRPPSFDEADVDDKPHWVRALPPLTPRQVEDIDRIFAMRLRAMLSVQSLIGAIVDTLAAVGKLDDTYVFFTSDNGYHFGEHRLLPGKQTPYEEDLRVPLLVRGPGVAAGTTLPHLVGNVDFAPTFLALAGLPIRDDLDGHSMAPLLGPAPPSPQSWRQAYLLEHLEEPSRHHASENPERVHLGTLEPIDPQTRVFKTHWRLPAIPSFNGLRLTDMVYVEYETGERELYDLSKDPWELTNIASTASPDLLAHLAAWLAAMRACAGPGCRSTDLTAPASH